MIRLTHNWETMLHNWMPLLPLLEVWISINNVLFPIVLGQTTKPLFLNSYAHCGSDNRYDSRRPFIVDENTIYNLQDDASPWTNTHTYRRECEIVLQSDSIDGRLCVLMRKLAISKCGTHLELFDGWAGIEEAEKPAMIFNCSHYPTSAEWCTMDRFLSFNLVAGSSLQTVVIDWLVYNMHTKHRRIFMDSKTYCGSVFELDSSLITLLSIDSESEVKDVVSPCTLTFEYVGHDENKTLCLVFESKNNPNCGIPYALDVTESENPSEKMQTYTCKNPHPSRWCSMHTVFDLVLYRNNNTGTTENLFTVYILDHVGGAETISLPHDSMSEDHSLSHTGIIAVATVSFIVVLIIVAVLIFFILRYQQHWQGHKAVPNTATQNGRASYEEEML